MECIETGIFSNHGEVELLSVAIFNDTILCGTATGTIYAYNSVEGASEWKKSAAVVVSAERAGITALAVSSTGSHLAVGRDGGELCVFRVDFGPPFSFLSTTPVFSHRLHVSALTVMKFSDCGQVLVSGDARGSVVVSPVPSRSPPVGAPVTDRRSGAFLAWGGGDEWRGRVTCVDLVGMASVPDPGSDDEDDEGEDGLEEVPFATVVQKAVDSRWSSMARACIRAVVVRGTSTWTAMIGTGSHSRAPWGLLSASVLKREEDESEDKTPKKDIIVFEGEEQKTPKDVGRQVFGVGCAGDQVDALLGRERKRLLGWPWTLGGRRFRPTTAGTMQRLVVPGDGVEAALRMYVPMAVESAGKDELSWEEMVDKIGERPKLDGFRYVLVIPGVGTSPYLVRSDRPERVEVGVDALKDESIRCWSAQQGQGLWMVGGVLAKRGENFHVVRGPVRTLLPGASTVVALLLGSPLEDGKAAIARSGSSGVAVQSGKVTFRRSRSRPSGSSSASSLSTAATRVVLVRASLDFESAVDGGDEEVEMPFSSLRGGDPPSVGVSSLVAHTLRVAGHVVPSLMLSPPSKTAETLTKSSQALTAAFSSIFAEKTDDDGPGDIVAMAKTTALNAVSTATLHEARRVIRALQHDKSSRLAALLPKFQNLQVPPDAEHATSVSNEQAATDADRDAFLINDVEFRGEGSYDAVRAALAVHIQRVASLSESDAIEAAQGMLRAASRTATGGDSWFALRALAGADAILIPYRATDAASASDDSTEEAAAATLGSRPVSIHIHDDGAVHIEADNCFRILVNLDDEGDVEQIDQALALRVLVSDVGSLKGGERKRTLSLALLEDE